MNENKTNFIPIVIRQMENIEKVIDLTGIQKKEMVLRTLETILGSDVYLQYEALLSETIDLLVCVSRKTISIALNKKTRKLLFTSCCSTK